MNSLIHLLKYITILAVVIITSADTSYAQTNDEVVSYFVKEQLEVKENQTVFNVFKIKNNSNQLAKIQVNFTLPVDWEFFGERTHYLDIAPGREVNIPIRISPSKKAKGGIGYALNASLLTMNGTMFATKYCFLTVPIRTKLDAKFSSISYYLDHRYGKSQLTFNIKNDGNSHRLMGLKLSCDERITFVETGQDQYNTEISLEAGKDTTIRTTFKFNDMIENLKYFNKTMIAEISTSDSLIKKYSFVRFLDNVYENYIEDADHPLVLELSTLDVLSDAISYRLLALGKLKFKNNRNISYYYRSNSGPLKSIPDQKYDEYFVKYTSPKNILEAGNLRDDYQLSMFGHGAKYQQYINPNTYFKISVLNNVYSDQTAFSGSFGQRLKRGSLSAAYTKVINDTTQNSYMDMYGIDASYQMGKAGGFNVRYQLNKYNEQELDGKTGHYIDATYSNHIKRLYMYINTRSGSPYSASFHHGRNDLTTNFIYSLTNRSYLQANYQRFSYKPASIYNNLSEDLNYKYHNVRLLYNYVLALNSVLYMGPNCDYGTSNYVNNELTDELRLGSLKAEIGYRFSPKWYGMQNLNINMQIGQTKPFAYNKDLYTPYSGVNNVLKFSATIQGKRWGVYGMYYSGLYNMSMALNNFYTGTAGKYLYFMPYFRITSANKQFYYEIRFSYLNNIDLKTTRTSILQEAGADFGRGWSMRLQNSTNIQALQDASGQSYRYTNNYMEFTVRKVFKWNQPGQKYHTLKTVFYRDIDGNRIRGNNEPLVENVVMDILNNSTIDTSYHYNGEMFGNIETASNFEGYTVYRNIPEAQYMLTFKPTDEQNERFNIQENNLLVDLRRDTTIYVPFVERNLVFGTVKFNRAKRSAIQDLRLDGIKVSITDSHGESWYAFTDQQGYYEIFAPVADFYTVKIENNIWSEYFDLRQDQYIIKFNGYKRFEVNFEFDEKKREIKFDDVMDIDDIVSGENFRFEDVTQIKQTILRGTISDENTLAPIQATVEVIDLLRHDVITKMKSSSTNGSFFTTFITGKNYQLKITAPGYWVHQEQLSSDQLTTFETINRDGLMLKRINVGKSMELQNLLFAENSAELTPEAKAELENVVILLANNENVHINVAGYCSNVEREPALLSMQRARKVVDFLTFRGISASRITMEGRGTSGAQFQKVDIIVTSNR